MHRRMNQKATIEGVTSHLFVQTSPVVLNYFLSIEVVNINFY